MRSDRRRTTIASLCMVVSLLAPAPARTTLYDEVRITHNEYQDEYPRIGGDKIVWHGWDKFDYEIYCYDIVTRETTEITHNVYYDDVYPSTDGEYILWARTEPDEYDYSLYLHEIGTGETSLLAEVPVSGASLDGGIVAWIDEGAGSDELFLYDASTGETTQVTDDSLPDGYARVSQGRVAWKKAGTSPSYTQTLFVYNVSTGETVEVYSTDQYFYQFDFKGNRLAWTQQIVPDGSYQVLTHDLLSGETLQVTDSDHYKDYLMAGEPGIIWTEYDWEGEPYESERVTRLHYWDFLTGQARVLNNSSVSGVHAWYVHMHGNDLVWTGAIFLDDEIFHHDLSTGLTTQVTHDIYTDEQATVHEGTVVWHGFDFDSQRYEIYLGVPCLDGDGDGFEDAACGGADCDDENPAVYPRAPGEVPGDGVDTNCNGSNDCFIATTAFGSPRDGRIEVLRSFRDKVLLGHPAGEALVATYYRYGPPMAEAIAEREWMRSLIRALLLPVVGFALLFT